MYSSFPFGERQPAPLASYNTGSTHINIHHGWAGDGLMVLASEWPEGERIDKIDSTVKEEEGKKIQLLCAAEANRRKTITAKTSPSSLWPCLDLLDSF